MAPETAKLAVEVVDTRISELEALDVLSTAGWSKPVSDDDVSLW